MAGGVLGGAIGIILIDNRFGEMFYGGLFWNRYVKDVSIGSFLSLGWNLGFGREFLGAPPARARHAPRRWAWRSLFAWDHSSWRPARLVSRG